MFFCIATRVYEGKLQYVGFYDRISQQNLLERISRHHATWRDIFCSDTLSLIAFRELVEQKQNELQEKRLQSTS